MAFMKRNSPIRSNQLKRTSSDSGPSVRPKKWTENLDCQQQQQPSDQISSVQDSSKSSKTTKTPNKLVKPVNCKKPLITRPSPYSYSCKKVTHVSFYFRGHLMIISDIAPTIANSCQKMHLCDSNRRKNRLSRVTGKGSGTESSDRPREVGIS